MLTVFTCILITILVVYLSGFGKREGIEAYAGLSFAAFLVGLLIAGFIGESISKRVDHVAKVQSIPLLAFTNAKENQSSFSGAFLLLFGTAGGSSKVTITYSYIAEVEQGMQLRKLGDVEVYIREVTKKEKPYLETFERQKIYTNIPTSNWNWALYGDHRAWVTSTYYTFHVPKGTVKKFFSLDVNK